MKALEVNVFLAAALLLIMSVFSACESTESSSHSSASVYYDTGLHDPWYDGDDYYPPDVIATPPEKPDTTPRPSHPIATPPMSAPRPTPMPSIPRAPRASFRR